MVLYIISQKDVLSLRTFCLYGHFVPPDVLSLRMFCPYGRLVSTDVLSLRTFCPTDFMSPGIMSPDVLSPDVLSPDGLSLRTFCHQTFCLGTLWPFRTQWQHFQSGFWPQTWWKNDLAKLSENNFFIWAFLRLKHCKIAMIHCLFLEMGRGSTDNRKSGWKIDRFFISVFLGLSFYNVVCIFWLPSFWVWPNYNELLV